jgi:hypothetical protein
LPRVKKPRVRSLRSSDQVADVGVVPTPEEQATFGIRIVQLTDTPHNNMDDDANTEQRAAIRSWVLAFSKER